MAFSASRGTPRDPLPLPLVANAGGASGTLPGCRATRQGHGRRAAASADVNRCIEALNEMYAAAHRELRVLGAYDQEPCTRAAFDSSRVSIPDVGGTPVPLAELWGPGGAEAVERFISDKVLPSDAAASRL